MYGRRWEFEPPPYWMYPQPPMSNSLSLEQAMEAKRWWEHMEKELKKEEKKEEKGWKHHTYNNLQVLLLLIGTSPMVAIIYKIMIIPILIR